MGALGRSGRVALRTAPISLCWHPHWPTPLQGAGVEALSARGGWHSPGECQEKHYSLCQGLWGGESRYRGAGEPRVPVLRAQLGPCMSPSSAAGRGPRTANLTPHNAIPLQEVTPLWLLAVPREGCLWLTHPGPLIAGTELLWAGLALSGGLPVRERALGPPNLLPYAIVGGPASLPPVEVGLDGGSVFMPIL